MQLKHRFLAVAACATLVTGCGNDATEDAPASVADEGVASTADGTEPELFGEAAEAVPTAPPVSCDPGAFCEGPLVVRVDRLNLVPRNYSNTLAAALSGTLSIENRTAEDLRVIQMDENIRATLANGISGSARARDTGLNICRNDGSACFAQNPDSFRLLAPGDSPAKINVALEVRYPAQMTPSMGDVETATITFQLYSVSASGEKRLHQISLADAPIQNRMAE